MGTEVFLTTSWDDGHPLDERLADLLAVHDVPATFYVPRRNVEGRPVLSDTAIRKLHDGFEIGGHTLDHKYLHRLDRNEVERQVAGCKSWLEDLVGQGIAGFCYPGGKTSAAARASVRRAGFEYARTVESFSFRTGRRSDAMPTTVHFYPTQAIAHLRNFLKWGSWAERAPGFLASVREGNPQQLVAKLLSAAERKGGVIHIWGHSWELEELGLWHQLSGALQELANTIPQANRLTNRDVFRAFGRL